MLILSCAGALVAPAQAWADVSSASRFYEDGVVRQRQGDLKGAVVQLKNALQQDTSLLPARMLLGTIYLELGQGAAAEHEIALASRLGADRTLTAEPMARALLLQGKYAELLETAEPEGFERGVAARLLVLRGHAQAEMGSLADAEQTFARAERLDPDSAGAVVGQAMVALRRGQMEQARASVQHALLLDRQASEAWKLKAAIEHAAGNPDAALTAYARVLADDARELDARVARAGLLIDLGRDAEAQQDVDYLKAEFAWDPRGYYLHSLLLQRAGDHDGMRAALQESAAALSRLGDEVLHRRAPFQLLGGLVHYGLGEYERAIEYLTGYVRRLPGQPGARKVLGAALLARGDHFRAVDVLEPALRARPNDSRTMELLGMAYMRRGWHVQAAELLDRAARLNPVSPGVRIDAAINRLAAGEADAVLELEQVFEQHRDQTAAGVMAVMTYLRRAESESALRIARDLSERAPDNLTILNLLASAQVGAGHLDSARATLQRILREDADFVPARLNLARLERLQGDLDAARQRLGGLVQDHAGNVAAMVELAHIARARGELNEAIEWLEKARATAPDYVPASVLLVDMHLQTQRTDAAMAVAKEAIARRPDDLEIVLALARAALAAGDAKLARSVLSTRSYLAGFDADWLLRIAELQRAAGAPVEAVYSLQKAAKGDPGSVSVRMALAEALIAAQRWDEAADAAAALRRTHPDSAVGHRLAGDVEFYGGRYAEALSSYRAALALEPEAALAIRVYNSRRALGQSAGAVAFLEQWLDRAPRDRMVRQTLAEAYVSTGRATEAIVQFEQLLRDEPDNVSVLNNLAYLLADRDSARARELAQRAYAVAPEDAAVNDTLGWIMVKQGEPRQGLAYLREAQFRDAGDPAIRYHVAVALSALGRNEEARVELNKALANGRPFPEEASARSLLERLGSAVGR